MTDKPTPTDVELKAMWQIHAADIGGIFYYARAVLAKWGQPVVAGDVDRADAVNLARNALTQYDCAITKKGVRVLAEAVLSMDSALTTPQPTQAQAAEPVGVVVPCYTPSGKRVALYSAKQDLPIGTKLYPAPQPSPTAQAAESVEEDAACEAIEKVLALFPFNVPTQKFTVNNGPCLTADNDDEFYSVKRVLAFLTEIKTTLDAARKQGATK